MNRYHDIKHLTTDELQRAQRDLRATSGLITPDSPAHVPIQAEMQAIDTELAGRAENEKAGKTQSCPS